MSAGVGRLLRHGFRARTTAPSATRCRGLSGPWTGDSPRLEGGLRPGGSFGNGFVPPVRKAGGASPVTAALRKGSGGKAGPPITASAGVAARESSVVRHSSESCESKKPMGVSGSPRWQRRCRATDSSTGHTPEVGVSRDALATDRADGARGRAAVVSLSGGVTQFHLWGRETLRRVSRLRGGSGLGTVLRHLSVVGLKPGEPHDWLQDATSLRGSARRKPSKPGGTARTERVLGVASQSPGQPGVDSLSSCRWRGVL